ncbi:MAG TPA: hypothetical protein VLQ89_01110 [Candidatus Binatia bacterium]|nr:hypothetical protein [Candidatus Binatia bacterium]
MLGVLLLANHETGVEREKTERPIADVFEVMDRVAELNVLPLWPGFDTNRIPVAVFDGLNTYLFNGSEKPDGFSSLPQKKGVFFFIGRQANVRGNSVIQLAGQWTATSVLSASSQRTGEKYGLRDMAGIIVHEQFHVFQRTRHPRWRQNDGLLLLYPKESAEALYLRRREKEAFRRAVLSAAKKDVAGWAAAALRCRQERLAGLPAPFVQYENELQRTEGLSDYIERVARGLDPLNASNITNGIAPAGVRDLGYVEGRWMAMILDKLRPDWKTVLEKDVSRFLEDILSETVQAAPAAARSFAAAEVEAMKTAAESDFSAWQKRKKTEMEAYAACPGTRLEIDASARPLAIRIFEPLEIEPIEDGGVFHRMIFAAANETGNLRIAGHPCLTWFDHSLRVTRLVINGLKQAPEIAGGGKKLILKTDGISIELPFTTFSVKDTVYRIEL